MMTALSILRNASSLEAPAAKRAVRASAQISLFSDVSAPIAGPGPADVAFVMILAIWLQVVQGDEQLSSTFHI